jgi:hypothetical protein
MFDSVVIIFNISIARFYICIWSSAHYNYSRNWREADRGRLRAYRWRFKQPLLVHTSLMISPPPNLCVNPPCQLSLWEETGVPGENPRLSAERRLLLFSHEDWVRVALRRSHGGLNLRPSRWKASALTTSPPKPRVRFCNFSFIHYGRVVQNSISNPG